MMGQGSHLLLDPVTRLRTGGGVTPFVEPNDYLVFRRSRV